MARDMTYAQFRAALKRNKFSRPFLLWCQDLENPDHSCGIVIDSKGRLCKRETIAHLLASRKSITHPAKTTKRAAT